MKMKLQNCFMAFTCLKHLGLLLVAGAMLVSASATAGALDDLFGGLKRQVEDAVRQGAGQTTNGTGRQSSGIPSHDEWMKRKQEDEARQRAEAAKRTRDIQSARMTEAQERAENQRRAVEAETFSEIELREMERQIFNGPSRNKNTQPSTIYSYRKAWDAPLQGYNYFPLFRVISPGQTRPYKGFYRLVCNYDPKAAPSNLHFWYRRRPVSEITAPNDWSEGRLTVYDIAVDACPATVGEGLKLVFGDDALDKALAFGNQRQQIGSMSEAERKDYFERERKRRFDERYAAFADWDKDAKSNSPARDRQLAQSVNTAISGLERNGRNLTVATLKQVLDTSLRDNLLELARSAKARAEAIPVGVRHRRDFDKWDDEVGGLVLKALNRLDAIGRLNSTSSNEIDFRQLAESDHARSVRRADWLDSRELDFTVPVARYFGEVFKRHLEGQPLLDRAYVAEMKRRLNATKLVSDKWRASVDVPPSRNNQDDQTELMTLDELAAAEFGGAIGRGLGGAVAGYMKVKQANAEFNERIASARRDFWSCYARHCADAAQHYFEYSKALRDKDMYYMVTPEVNLRIGGAQQAMNMEMVLGALGSLSVDGGASHPNCGSVWEEAKASLSLHIGDWRPDLSNIESSRRELLERVARFTLSPDYGKWLQCRDYQEYVDRPRTGGL